ncbi:hypothetical protein FKW77_008343 [Venturia effusa]|uniref:Uncharacterized protein n=1 Tax=Venturia effusa TaxID=50376 RepID=A0A517LLZ3_9PEZI|nr:hypothetical protein FKW77_008343 [Venturia effusa]
MATFSCISSAIIVSSPHTTCTRLHYLQNYRSGSKSQSIGPAIDRNRTFELNLTEPSSTATMCYIDMTNYQQCADSQRHNHPRRVDRRQFASYLRSYHYTSQEPGFFPCEYVLTGRVHPDQCRTQVRLAEPRICPHCNGTWREYNHSVTYRSGSIVAVGPVNPLYPEDGHTFHLLFVNYCHMCRRDVGRYAQDPRDHRGPSGYDQQYPGYDARYHAPHGPPNGHPRGWDYDW